MKTPTAHAAPAAIAAIASLAVVGESRICIATVMLYFAASASSASIVPEERVVTRDRDDRPPFCRHSSTHGPRICESASDARMKYG